MKIEEKHFTLDAKEQVLTHSLAVLLATTLDAEGVKTEDPEKMLNAALISAERSFIALREEDEDKIPTVEEFIGTTVIFARKILNGEIQALRFEDDNNA